MEGEETSSVWMEGLGETFYRGSEGGREIVERLNVGVRLGREGGGERTGN